MGSCSLKRVSHRFPGLVLGQSPCLRLQDLRVDSHHAGASLSPTLLPVVSDSCLGRDFKGDAGVGRRRDTQLSCPSPFRLLPPQPPHTAALKVATKCLEGLISVLPVHKSLGAQAASGLSLAPKRCLQQGGQYREEEEKRLSQKWRGKRRLFPPLWFKHLCGCTCVVFSSGKLEREKEFLLPPCHGLRQDLTSP